MQTKIDKLIAIAAKKMRHSKDPVHDLDHVERVVEMVSRLAEDLELSKKHTQALILAAWWHDVSRTITRRPSFVYMIFIDDIISSFMLWIYTIRFGLFGSVAGMATRIILCRSFGSGKLFIRVLLRKKTRILADILDDADNMDILRVTRIQKMQALVESSASYHMGYRILTWWNFSTNQLRTKTKAAEKYLLRMMREFLQWIKKLDVLAWHEQQFGKRWIKETVYKIQKTILSHERYA